MCLAYGQAENLFSYLYLYAFSPGLPRYRLLDPSHHPTSSTELYDGHQDDVDFIATITAKMKRAKEYWTGKTEALRVLWNDLSRNRDEQASPFNLVLRLFTYEDVLGEMDEAFNHDPASITFYIPQLVTFLLYGAYWSSASLQVRRDA